MKSSPADATKASAAERRRRPASARPAIANATARRGRAAEALRDAADADAGTLSKADRRLAEIIDAAASVFARLGYHGASTQDIADVVGIRQASLYYYLPSKEAALEAVCNRGVAGFYENALEIAASQARAPDKIAAIVRAHLLPLKDRRDYVTVFLNERRHLPRENRSRILKWTQGYETVIEGIIRDGVTAGAFRADLDPRLATLGLLGMIRTVADWYGKEPRMTLDDIVAGYTALLLAGLTDSPAQHPSAR